MNHLKSLLKQKIAAYEKLVKFTWLKFETTNSEVWLNKHRKVCDSLYNAKIALEAIEANEANFCKADNGYLKFLGIHAYDVVSLSGKVIFTIDIENV